MARVGSPGLAGLADVGDAKADFFGDLVACGGLRTAVLVDVAGDRGHADPTTRRLYTN